MFNPNNCECRNFINKDNDYIPDNNLDNNIFTLNQCNNIKNNNNYCNLHSKKCINKNCWFKKPHNYIWEHYGNINKTDFPYWLNKKQKKHLLNLYKTNILPFKKKYDIIKVIDNGIPKIILVDNKNIIFTTNGEKLGLKYLFKNT